MVRWEDAWNRALNFGGPGKPHPFIVGKKKSDFRSLNYGQIFSNVPVGSTSGNLLQTFPAGAFILGIEAAAVLPRVLKADQYYADGATAPLDSTQDRFPSCTPGNLDMFSVNLAYTNDENITPGGPICAASLFGPNGGQFPTRELIVDPSQGLLCQVKNEVFFQLISGAATAAGVTYSINVHITYRAMVPRAIG